MDPLVGATVAAGAAWLSIVGAAWMPIKLDVRRIRLAAAATLALIGLIALGLPAPGWSPLVVVAAGLVWAWPRQA